MLTDQQTNADFSSEAGISRSTPSLITNALGLVSFFRDSSAFCAFPSCITPTVALTITTTNIIIASLASCSKKEMAAAFEGSGHIWELGKEWYKYLFRLIMQCPAQRLRMQRCTGKSRIPHST